MVNNINKVIDWYFNAELNPKVYMLAKRRIDTGL